MPACGMSAALENVEEALQIGIHIGMRVLQGVAHAGLALVDAAAKQMKELPFYNAFFQTATPPAIELAEMLASVTPPQFQHVFFSGSGSEGNDTIVRMIWNFWDLEGRPEKRILISREYAYHGSTVAASSLGGMSNMHSMSGVLPGVEHVLPPYRYKYGPDESPDAFGRRAADALEQRILAREKQSQTDHARFPSRRQQRSDEIQGRKKHQSKESNHSFQ